MTAKRLGDRLAFGSPDLAITVFFATVNGWFLFYLVSVLALPPLAAGTVFVAGRLLDGLLDPLIGAWTDRRGRKRAIVMGLPIAAPAFVALWAAPSAFDSDVARLLAAGLAFAVFAVGYTMISVSRLGMLPDFAPTYDDRSAQVGIDMGFVFIAVALASTGVPALVHALGGGALSDSAPSAWIAAAVGLAMLGVLAFLPFLIRISERPRRGPPAEAWTGITQLPATPRAITTLAVFINTVVALISLQAALPFWLEAGPGLDASGQVVVLAWVFAATFASLPIWIRLCQARGKAGALRIACVLFISALAFVALAPARADTSFFLIGGAFVAGAATGGLSVCPWAMVPDVGAAHAARLGQAVEGVAAAAFTMANKAAAAGAVFGVSVAVGFVRLGEVLSVNWLLLLPALAAGTAAVLSYSTEKPMT